jgi:high-affinity Fe2+/Pb2+ permease
MRTEPAILVTFLSALIGLLVTLGIIAPNVADPLNLVVAEFVALLVASGLIIRANVTPV